MVRLLMILALGLTLLPEIRLTRSDALTGIVSIPEYGCW